MLFRQRVLKVNGVIKNLMKDSSKSVYGLFICTYQKTNLSFVCNLKCYNVFGRPFYYFQSHDLFQGITRNIYIITNGRCPGKHVIV